jgi:hypothetical protein
MVANMLISQFRNTASLAVALIVLLSGCSMFGGVSPDPMENLREQVQAVVTDPERAKTILELVDRMDQLLIESADLVAKTSQAERALFIDYDSTPQEFESLFSETRRDRQRFQKAILDVHLAIKAQATSDEWQVVRPAQASAVSAKVHFLVMAALDQRS